MNFSSSQTMVSILFFAVACVTSNTAPADAQATRSKAKPAAEEPAPAAPPAPAADTKPAGPDMTTETYGDWVLRCRLANSVKRCEVSQTIVIQGQANPLAMIAVGREKAGDPLRMVVQLPVNVAFDGGVKAMLADGTQGAELGFRRCLPAGCFADAGLDDAALGNLTRQTEPGLVKFKDAGNREIALPLSLKGLSMAIEALQRQ